MRNYLKNPCFLISGSSRDNAENYSTDFVIFLQFKHWRVEISSPENMLWIKEYSIYELGSALTTF